MGNIGPITLGIVLVIVIVLVLFIRGFLAGSRTGDSTVPKSEGQTPSGTSAFKRKAGWIATVAGLCAGVFGVYASNDASQLSRSLEQSARAGEQVPHGFGAMAGAEAALGMLSLVAAVVLIALGLVLLFKSRQEEPKG